MKDIFVVGKKMILNGQKMVIYGHKVSELILPKLKKKWKQKKVFYVVAFDPIRI